MARRLIESGVRFVEVTLDGWDTHRDNFRQTRALSEARGHRHVCLARRP